MKRFFTIITISFFATLCLFASLRYRDSKEYSKRNSEVSSWNKGIEDLKKIDSFLKGEDYIAVINSDIELPEGLGDELTLLKGVAHYFLGEEALNNAITLERMGNDPRGMAEEASKNFQKAIDEAAEGGDFYSKKLEANAYEGLMQLAPTEQKPPLLRKAVEALQEALLYASEEQKGQTRLDIEYLVRLSKEKGDGKAKKPASQGGKKKPFQIPMRKPGAGGGYPFSEM